MKNLPSPPSAVCTPPNQPSPPSNNPVKNVPPAPPTANIPLLLTAAQELATLLRRLSGKIYPGPSD